MRRQGLCAVYPKTPQGFKDYLLKTCNYVLQNKNSSTLSIPTVSIDSLVQTFALPLKSGEKRTTVMILSFRTDRSGETVQTRIRLLLEVYTVCHSVCIFWMHYSVK